MVLSGCVSLIVEEKYFLCYCDRFASVKMQISNSVCVQVDD